jgi:hypothetical protein
MRFLLRLAVLALAAVGVKALYDRFAPRATGLRGPAANVLGSAGDAAVGVAQHAKDAATDVVDDARHRAGGVRDQASAVVDAARDDVPTVATEADEF